MDQVIPRQTLQAGVRVELRYDSGDYDGYNFLRAGLRATVVGFATPDIQRRQVWPEESYYVRLDCDTPDSIGRVFNVDRLRVISSHLDDRSVERPGGTIAGRERAQPGT